MPLQTTSKLYMGKGKVHVRRYGSNAPLRYIGPTGKLSTAISTDKKELPNLETVGGGNLMLIERVKSFSGSTEMWSLDANNLAMALRGSMTDEALATVTDEPHIGMTSGLVLFQHLPDPDVAITPTIDVTGARANTTAYKVGDTILNSAVIYQATTAGTSAASAPTFTATLGATTADGTVTWTSRGAAAMVEGTDYAKVKSGIELMAPRFALGLPLKVSYTQNPAQYVQILTTSGDEYEMVFDGLNEVDSGNPVPVQLYRVKFSPTSGLDFKGEDFGKLPLSFEVLPDATKVGTGISQYGRIGMAA